MNTQPENQPVPDSRRLPWEREQGWLSTFFSTTAMIIFNPSNAFALRPAGAYYKPWLYAFIAGLISGILSDIITMAITGLDSGATLGLIMLLPRNAFFAGLGLGVLAIWAVLIHFFLRSKTEPAPYWATARVMAYVSAITMIYSPLDDFVRALLHGQKASSETALLFFLVALLFGIWGTYIQCLALDIIHGRGKLRIFFILLLIDIALGVILLIGIVLVAILVGAFRS